MHDLADKLDHALTDLLIAAATAALIMLRDWVKRKPRKHVPLDAIHAHDLTISGAITECGVRLNALRVYVAQYRNGEFYDSGNPVQRKSRTHEWCRGGVTPQAQNHRDMLIGLLPDEYTLVKQDGASFTRVEELPRGNFRSLCESEGARAIARAAVRRGGNIVGFVGADFEADEQPANVGELLRCADLVSFELASAVKAEV